MKIRTQQTMVILAVVVPLIGVITAMFLLWNRYFFWSDFVLLAVFYVLTGLGITIGFHRMLTHDGFQAPSWLRALFMILGCMANEGPPDLWAATHIKHHAHSDEEDDPHSPTEGFFHAHMGWFLLQSAENDHRKTYAPHLLNDPTVQWVSRLWPLWSILGLLLPYLLGGWTGFVWGGLVRVFLVNHVTWSVNSVCHMFGSRAFQTADQSRNEWLVGILALGEGWHNNHHAFPHNAFHGMRWWQFDLSGLVIRFLERVGLVKQVQRVSLESEEAYHVRSAKQHVTLTDYRSQVAANIAFAKEELQLLVQSLPQAQTFTELQQMYMYAHTRLNTIQKYMSRAAIVRRHRLQQYMDEAQTLLQEVRQAANQAMAART